MVVGVSLGHALKSNEVHQSGKCWYGFGTTVVVESRFSIRTRSESEQDVEDVCEKAKILWRRNSLYVDATIFAFSRADSAY